MSVFVKRVHKNWEGSPCHSSTLSAASSPADDWAALVFHACAAAKREEPTDLSLRAKIAIEGAIMTLPAPPPTADAYACFAELLVAVWDAIDNPLVRGVVTEDQVLVYSDKKKNRGSLRMGV